MDIRAINAAQAYAATASGQPTPPATGTEGAAGANGGAFTDFLEQAVGSAVEASNAAESAGLSVAAGQGDMIDIVTAVSQAEIAVQTVVTIRDRVVQAYQDILKMPI